MKETLVYRADCPFCKIAQGLDAKAEIVAESDNWLAFFPLDPATAGHTLIIPRIHVANFWEAPENLDAELAIAARLLGEALRIALEPEGLNLITSAGKAAEQTVFHLHIHLVPRARNDGFGHIWPHNGAAEGEESRLTAAKIRKAWEALAHQKEEL